MHMQNDPATDLAAQLPRLEALARQAGDIAMGWFRPGARTTAEVTYKNGGSPVTEADYAVDRFLHDNIAAIAPDAGWLSEETLDNVARLTRTQLVVVDPIDGTTAFTRGDDRWSVSIALIDNGRAVAGVVHAPALGRTYAAALGRGATLNGAPIFVSGRASLAGARIVAPRPLHPQLEQAGFSIAPRVPSLALRLAEIAGGGVDLAVAAPNSRDWDIAAADVIIREAGGLLTELEGAPLTYNRPRLSRGALVAAPKAIHDESLALARRATKDL